jgi:glycosyltransferase involved in cell wall biosynthesis
MKKIKIAIDASRNRSGGAKIHLIEILNNFNYDRYNIKEIHLWSYHELLKEIPNYPWLVKHVPLKNPSILKELFWQYFIFPKALKKLKVDILLNSSAATICYFKPNVTMSRNMLSFEKGMIKKSGFSIGRIRLILLKYIQKISLKNANGAIFLTNYASKSIQSFTGKLENVKIINHGISNIFFAKELKNVERKKLKCVYVSTIDFYKHQSNVVKALSQFESGTIELILAGGLGSGTPALMSKKKLDETIKNLGHKSDFVKVLGHIPHSKLPELYKNSDIVIFASSCENMPNTLVEGMASGLPIACSNRGPMPEILQDGGTYFDPENIDSIYHAIKTLVDNYSKRLSFSKKSYSLSKNFSWEKCSKETFDFLIKSLKH